MPQTKQSWQAQLRDSITDPADLAERLRLDSESLIRVNERYPLRISPYYLSLIERADDPIGRQAIPAIEELHDPNHLADPLDEEERSPVPGLVHRYSDRALLLTGTACATYCRFCTRKRHVGCTSLSPNIDGAINYIAAHPEIRDVLLSGGDPLMLDDDRLHSILKRLRAIEHVEIIRIGTRIPVTLPARVTEQLCNVLREHAPLYVNLHFNHLRELTPQSSQACRMLAAAGCILGNQTVLLRGVNDHLGDMLELNRGLLRIGVRPYYLHQMDLTQGTGHFRTPLASGIRIMEGLQGKITGMGMPRYVIDTPGGHGKVPVLSPQVVRTIDGVRIRCADGRIIDYPDLPEQTTRNLPARNLVIAPDVSAA